MIYDYECQECGHLIKDVSQSIKDDALTKCPKCKKNSLQRIIYGGIHASVKRGSPTTIGQLAEQRYEEGNNTLPDGRVITKVEWNKSDMRERQEKRAHDKKTRKQEEAVKNKKLDKINKMTPEQKRNYIRNGE